MARLVATAFELRANATQPIRALDRINKALRQRLNPGLKASEKQARRTSRAYRGASASAERFAGTLLGGAGLYLAAHRTARAIGAMTGAALEFDRNMRNVSRTSKLTGSNLDALGERILGISSETGVGADNVAAMVAQTGQLGIKGAEGLEKFGRAVSILTRTTNLTGEAAVTTLGRLLKLTGSNVVDNAERLGSVLVDLGANAAATESEIGEVAIKLTPVLRIFGVAADDILGISTALASAGREGASAATAFTKLFTAFRKFQREGSDVVEVIAEVARVSSEEANRLIQDDIALLGARFLSGLQGVENFQDVFAALGIPALREQKEFQALADPAILEYINRARAQSAAPFAAGNELARALGTTSGNFDQAVNDLRNAFVLLGKEINDELLPDLALLGNGLARLLDITAAGQARKLFELAGPAARAGDRDLIERAVFRGADSSALVDALREVNHIQDTQMRAAASGGIFAPSLTEATEMFAAAQERADEARRALETELYRIVRTGPAGATIGGGQLAANTREFNRRQALEGRRINVLSQTARRTAFAQRDLIVESMRIATRKGVEDALANRQGRDIGNALRARNATLGGLQQATTAGEGALFRREYGRQFEQGIIRRETARIREQQEKLEEIELDRLDRIESRWREVGDTFGETLGDMIRGTASLRDVFRNTIEHIRNNIIDQLVVDPVSDAVSNAIVGAVKGTFLGGFADGGVAHRAGVALVGERGPELVGLRQGMGVSPIGGGGLTINVNGVSDPNVVRREIRAMYPEIIQVQNQAIIAGSRGNTDLAVATR